MSYMINEFGSKQFGLIGIASLFIIGGYLALFEMGFAGSVMKYVTEFNIRKDYHKMSTLISSVLLLFLSIAYILMIII